MGTRAEEKYSEVLPPRRGAVLVIATDTTARPYDLKALTIGGGTPDGIGSKRQEVVLWMQAETNDVFFYFDSATSADLSETAAVAAGSTTTPTFSTTYGALLEAGGPPIRVRIDRKIDRWLILKSATAGILRIWAGSEST